MVPMRKTLPARGPKPPAISMLYFSRRNCRTLTSSTPSGIRGVLSVQRRWPAGTYMLRPMASMPETNASWLWRWRSQRAGRPSSATMARPSRKAYHRVADARPQREQQQAAEPEGEAERRRAGEHVVRAGLDEMAGEGIRGGQDVPVEVHGHLRLP